LNIPNVVADESMDKVQYNSDLGVYEEIEKVSDEEKLHNIKLHNMKLHNIAIRDCKERWHTTK